MECLARSSEGPIPDKSKILGVSKAPADKITSFLALYTCPEIVETPIARLESSRMTFETILFVTMVKFDGGEER